MERWKKVYRRMEHGKGLYLNEQGNNKIGIWVEGKRKEWVHGLDESEFYKDFIMKCESFENSLGHI